MSLNFSKFNFSFPKKFIIQIYFLIFIILNILDFLNLLSSDIDFFKKLLSWFIIGYIFYRVSLTKIFVGKRIKKYDLLFILGFSLMSIVKALVLFTNNGLYNPAKYYIFGFILTPISHIPGTTLIVDSFMIGLLIVVVTSILLLKNHNFLPDSFLGSFKYSEYMNFIKIQYLMLILFSIFFGLIIFNLFMEWFALAVDSEILVLGLFFYIFKYFHDNSKNKLSNHLRIIYSTGENFYQQVIMAFSNKKTFFIGISFLLTLHLLVDFGVYMIPYLFGTQNSLYFASLNVGGSFHTSLIGLLNFKHSLIFHDLTMTSSLLLQFIIVLIYIVSIFTISSFLILPFLIFYKNINGKKMRLNNSYAIIFLIGISFFFLISILPSLSNPIAISYPKAYSIKGVDIHTHSIISNISSIPSKMYSGELLVSFVMFLTVAIFLLFRYEKYKFFFDRLIFLFVLLFFIYYISIFFISSVNTEYNSLFHNTNSNSIFNHKLDIYLNSNYYKQPSYFTLNVSGANFKIRPFSTLNIKNFTLNSPHNDYLYITLSNNKFINLKFGDLSNLFVNNSNSFSNNGINSGNHQYIYFLGKNYFTIEKLNRGYKIINNLDSKTLVKKIFGFSTVQFEDYFIIFLNYLRLFFLSVFYIFGTITFARHYFKTNIYRF